jgi:hypothetical protein
MSTTDFAERKPLLSTATHKEDLPTSLHIEGNHLKLNGAEEPSDRGNWQLTEPQLAACVRFFHSFLLNMCICGVISR